MGMNVRGQISRPWNKPENSRERKQASGAALLFSRPPERLCLLSLLLDLELAKNRVPGNIDLVPLRLNAAQRALTHLAQKTERRRTADQPVNLITRRRSGLNMREDQFDFLHDDAFDLEEMAFICRPEFFGAGDVDEVVELFPAFDVGLDLGDQLVDFFKSHRRSV